MATTTTPTKITKLVDRVTGEARYYIDHGQEQLIGGYESREEAEAAATATTPILRYEQHDLDGRGAKRTHVYLMPPSTNTADPYWSAVTNVPCPAPRCSGTIRWAEAGYVPGYRICDGCGRHYLASGSTTAPTLLRFGSRRRRR